MSTATDASDPLRVIVRPLPKVVFFYPTWLMSAVCAILVSAPGIDLFWMIVAFFNLFVIAFDFDELRSVILGLVVGVGVLAGLYLDWLGPISDWAISLDPEMNQTFYMMSFIGFSLIFAFVWLQTRLDYWEFRPNEVVHRQGLFPKMKRFSTEDMRWDKRVPDVLELHDELERLAELDPRGARIVELRFFGGLTIEETAEALELGHATVERGWQSARAFLAARLVDGAGGPSGGQSDAHGS